MDKTPFFLYEAVVSLYPSDSNGQALTGLPVWLGSCVNNMRATMRLDERRIGVSGAAYKTPVHIDELHDITFDRAWIVQRTNPAVFKPVRNQLYVMEIVWVDNGTWLRRTYYGVTGLSADLVSRGVLEFDQRQEFHAQYYQDAGGYSSGVQVYTPAAPTGAAQPYGFFYEDALVPGSYLLGQYRFGVAMAVTGASVIAAASQNTPTTLTLEINGALTSNTVTIPTGTANEEVQASASFSGVTLNVGDTVRWKVTGGPSDGPSLADSCALMMTVQQI